MIFGFRICGTAITLVLLFSFAPFAPFAQAELDKASIEALEKTKELLVAPDQRREALKQDQNAADADKRIDQITSSPEDKQAIYELSAKIFDSTTHMTNGDVDTQKTLLENAMRDPEKFIKDLPADQQKQFRDLATQIDKKNSSISSPR